MIDLTANLRGYEAPAGVGERPGRAGVSLQVLAERDRAEVLAFEAATFQGGWCGSSGWRPRCWSPATGRAASWARCCSPARPAPPSTSRCWAATPAPSAVGVAAAARGAGVGSAMVAGASELLRDAGTRTCHIGWTQRERFYAPRLSPGGATMARRALPGWAGPHRSTR